MVGVRRRKSTSANSNTKKPRQKGPLDLGWKSRKGGNDEDEDDEYLESSSSDEDEDTFAARGGASSSDNDDDDDDEDETVDAKRVRMARDYLQKLEAQQTHDSSSDQDSDADMEDGTDRISARLQKERLQKEGTLEQELAHKVQHNLQSRCAGWTAQDWMSHNDMRSLRGHDLTPTCVAMPVSGEFCVSGSKDNSVLLYDVERATKTWTLEPQWKHTDMKYRRNDGEILSVACSDDGRYAVVGKRDTTVDIHDLRLASNQPPPPTAKSSGGGAGSVIHTFQGHKGPVTALTFRSQSLQLFSASQDRCIRHYNLDEMMYIETLYGHQAAVTQLDCHTKERPLSVGRDRTARAWKLTEDTHLIFRGGARWYPAECCTVLKDDWFVTGHEASMQQDASAGSGGTLALWLTEKKKPVTTLEDAHLSGITSLACVKGSDLVLSGSNDGLLKLWSVQTGKTSDSRGMESIGQIPIHGFVNDIAVGPKAQFCVAAVGQEPRLGRWERVAKAKNRIAIIQLRGGQQQEEEEDSDGDEESSSRMPEDTDSVEEKEQQQQQQQQQQQVEEESSDESSGSQEDESEESSSENESE